MDIAKYGIAIDARQVKDAEKALDDMGTAGGRAEKSLDGMSAQAKIAGGILGTALAASATIAAKSLLAAQIEADKLANTLKFATGANNLRAELDFTRKTAESLGLELVSSSQAYAKLAAAAKDTTLEGKGARDIFTAIGKASTVMGLSAHEANGALLAISQMISKGTVQAEELRGQLGERLPGAFQIAARAMGVTTSELGNMLEKGQVMADDFLPKLAKELERTLGDSAGSAAMSAQAGLNKLNNEWTLLLQSAAGTEAWRNTSGWMIESTTNWIKNLRASLEQGDWYDRLQWLVSGRVSGETTARMQGRRFVGGIEQIGPTEPAKAAQYKQPELSSQDKQLLDELRTKEQKASDQRAALYKLLEQDKISIDEYNKKLAALIEKNTKHGGATADRVTDYQKLIESGRERIAVLQAELASETKLTEGEKWAAKMLEDIATGKIKVTGAEREHAEAVIKAIGLMSQYQARQAEQREGVKRLAEEERKRNDELRASVQHDQDALDALKIRTQLMMQGVTASEDIAVALLEAQLASKDFTTATYEEIDALEKRIKIAREAATVAREGRQYEETQKAARDAAQAAAREWERTSEQIAQSLTDNIMRGGKSAGELLQDYFRTLVLRPIIQGTVQAGLNAVGLGGEGFGTAASQGLSFYNAGTNAYNWLTGSSSAVPGTAGSMGMGMPMADPWAATTGASSLYGVDAAGNVVGGLGSVPSSTTLVQGGTVALDAAAPELISSATAAGAQSGTMAALSAAAPYVTVTLAALQMAGVFDDAPDAMRTGNWQGALGTTTGSPDNHWFSGAEMNSALDEFAATLKKSETDIIKTLGLSTDQIASINKDIEALAGKQYNFGMEHQAIPAETFAQITRDRMAEVFDEIGDGLGELVRQSGNTYDAVMGTVGGLVQTSKGFKFIDGDLRGLTKTTVDAAGGVAQLAGATSFYLQNFYTDGERLAATMADLEPQFKALGFDHVPTTRDEFRKMVEALDLTTEAGRKTRGELLLLADDVAAVTSPSTVKAHREEYKPTEWAPTVAATASAFENAAGASNEYSQKLQLQRALYEATGDAAGLAAVEEEEHRLALAALPPALRELQTELWAVEKQAKLSAAEAAKAAKARELGNAAQQQEIEILTLQGDKSGALALKRQMELDAMDPSLRAQQLRIYALQDEQAATEVAAATEKRFADARKQAAADAVSQVDTAYSALARSVEIEKKAAQTAFDRESKALEDRAKTTADAITKLTSLSAMLQGALRQLQGTIQGPAITRQLAQAQISAALAIAKAGGGLPDEKTLQGALGVVAQPSEALFTSFEEYQRDQLKTANDIRDLATFADLGLDDAKTDQRLQEDQLTALKAGFAAETQRLDDILAKARDQVDAIKGVAGGLLTVADALGGLGAAISGAQLAKTVTKDAAAGARTAYSSSDILAAGERAASAGMTPQQIYDGLVLHNADIYAVGAAYGRSQDATDRLLDQAGVQRVPGFASGGAHSGGWRMVGEAGPELEYTPPSQIVSNRDARDLLDMAPLLEEMQMIHGLMAAMRGDTAQTQRNTKRGVDLFEVVTTGGEAMRTVAA